MFFKIFLLFVILPLIELALLIKIGTLIGAFNTIILIFITATVGAYMVRMEGLSVMRRLQGNLSMGVFPAEEIFDGALILIAGALLITPGVITDFIGFLFVFPVSRSWIKRLLKRYIKKKMSSGDMHMYFRKD